MREPQEAAEVVEPKAMPRGGKRKAEQKAQFGDEAQQTQQAKQKAMARAGKKDPEHAEDSDSSLPEHAEDSDPEDAEDSESSTYEPGGVAAYWQQKGREERAREKIQKKAKADLKKHPPPWRGSVAAYREPQAGQSSSSKGEAKNKLQLVGNLPRTRPS